MFNQLTKNPQSFGVLILTVIFLGNFSLNAEEKAKSSWTDRITLKGDFRYRLEWINDYEKDLRHRHRFRARFSVNAKISDSLDIGIRLGSGIDDPVSGNQTLTGAFKSQPVWIDLAYLNWHPSFIKGFNFTAGKMKNPYVTVQKSELLWDPDLRPEGLALSYKNRFGAFEPFLTGAGFILEERKETRDAWIWGIQGGLKLNLADEKFYILAGAGYINYLRTKGKETFYDTNDSYGNSVSEVTDSDGETTLKYKYDYNLIEIFGEIGGKIAGFPWAVFGSTVKNIETNTSVPASETGNTIKNDDNFGWLAGASLGKCKKSLDFSLRYIYKIIEKDAVMGIFTDSDFIGGGTDGRGHEWNLGFQIIKPVKLALTYFYNQKNLDDLNPYHRVQADLKVKF